jgi:hypothetical protein
MIRRFLPALIAATLATACTKKLDAPEADRPAPIGAGHERGPGPAAGADPLDLAVERARGALASEGGAAEVSVLDGPEGTRIVRAAIPGAYPGTGVAALIYDPRSGKTYGKHGERNIAQLVQERGWLARRLPDAQLIRLVHEARFDGILQLANPVVEPGAGGGLRVVLPTVALGGEPLRTWIVELPDSGAEAVK